MLVVVDDVGVVVVWSVVGCSSVVMVVVEAGGGGRRATAGRASGRGRRCPSQEPEVDPVPSARIGTGALSTPSKLTMSVSSSGSFSTTPLAPLRAAFPDGEGQAETRLRRQVARHAVLVVAGDLQRRRRARSQVDDGGYTVMLSSAAGTRHVDVSRCRSRPPAPRRVEARDDEVLLPDRRLRDLEVEVRVRARLLRQHASRRPAGSCTSTIVAMSGLPVTSHGERLARR